MSHPISFALYMQHLLCLVQALKGSEIGCLRKSLASSPWLPGWDPDGATDW